MSGYSLEDRQNENPNYKPFLGKTEFSIEEHIFIRIFWDQNYDFLHTDGMNMLIFE